MGESKLRIVIEAEGEQAERVAAKLNKTLGETGASAEKGSKGISLFGVSVRDIESGINVAQKALGTLKAAWDFAEQGAEIQRISDQWEASATRIGVSADQALAAIDRAAHGTVDDELIMQSATRSLTLGTAQSVDQLTKIMAIARASTKKFGGDTGEAFKGILESIDNLNPRFLKQAGIIPDVDKAMTDYARTLGKTKDDLTEAEQRQALLNATLQQGQGIVQEMAGAQDDASDKFKRVEVALGNVVDGAKELGANIAVGVIDAFDNLGRTLRGEETTIQKQVRLFQEMQQGGAAGARAFLELEKSGAITRKELEQHPELLAKIDAGMAELSAENERAARFYGRLIGPVGKFVEQVREQEAAAKAARDAQAAHSRAILDALPLAIEYTKDEKQLATMQAELARIDEEIAANGPRRTTSVQNAKLSAEERATAEAQLAVTLQQLNEAQAKLDPANAESALKVAQLNEKYSELNNKLGEHTAVVGGATKAQLEQRAATEAQIAEFQKAQEVERATQVFNALTKAFQDGALSEEEYRARAVQLNQVTGLYSNTALNAAVQQQELIKAFTDPASNVWVTKLMAGKAALDGVAGGIEDASAKTQRLSRQDMLDLGETSKGAQEKVEDAVDKVSKAADMASIKIVEVKGHLDELPDRKRVDIDIVVNGEVPNIPGGGGGKQQSKGSTKAFAAGGSFVVDGPPGVDRALVSFRATRGERVTVETPSQQRQASQAGGGDVHNYFINDELAMKMIREQQRRTKLARVDSFMN